MSSQGRYYFHKDHLGSSTAMTDATGAKVETTEYVPYGEMRDHQGTEVTNYKFTDQELDPEIGLYNYGARLYDPIIGRFITPDTIIPDVYDPQMLNRYAYCRNNPLIYIDPSGQKIKIGIERDEPTGISTPGTFTATSTVTGETVTGATIEHDPSYGAYHMAKEGDYKGEVREKSSKGKTYDPARIQTTVDKHRDDTTMIGHQLHTGHTVEDSTGCTIVGQKTSDPNTVTDSKKTMEAIMGLIDREIEVKSSQEPNPIWGMGYLSEGQLNRQYGIKNVEIEVSITESEGFKGYAESMGEHIGNMQASYGGFKAESEDGFI